jgi:hypothetical protein
MTINMQPLRWPEGQKRTRINQREKRGQWKKPLSHYIKELEAELTKLNAVGVVITGDLLSEKIDPGVAVYFSLPPEEASGDWQDILGIDSPKPTVQEIDARFKELRIRYSPDNLQTGNLDYYLKCEAAAREAKAWATGDFGKKHEKAIACDRYNEVRLNVKAIQVTIAALRRVEESGAPGFLERAFSGFTAPQLAERSASNVEHAAAAR